MTHTGCSWSVLPLFTIVKVVWLELLLRSLHCQLTPRINRFIEVSDLRHTYMHLPHLTLTLTRLTELVKPPQFTVHYWLYLFIFLNAWISQTLYRKLSLSLATLPPHHTVSLRLKANNLIGCMYFFSLYRCWNTYKSLLCDIVPIRCHCDRVSPAPHRFVAAPSHFPCPPTASTILHIHVFLHVPPVTRV